MDLGSVIKNRILKQESSTIRDYRNENGYWHGIAIQHLDNNHLINIVKSSLYKKTFNIKERPDILKELAFRGYTIRNNEVSIIIKELPTPTKIINNKDQLLKTKSNKLSKNLFMEKIINKK